MAKRNENAPPLYNELLDKLGGRNSVAGQLISGGGTVDKVNDYFLPSTQDEDAAAERFAQSAGHRYDSLTTPDLKHPDYGTYNWLGDYKSTDYQLPDDVNATTVQNTDVGPTALAGISGDPRLKEAQLAALASLQDIGANGMTAQEKADLARIQSEAAQADRGRREAIEQNMAARGMGGSGMSMLAKLSSSQAATDRAAQQGLDVAGMAQRRALDALGQAGTLAGGIRGQDFSEASRVAEAKDAVARFNAQNRNQTNQFNAGALNNMGQYNQSNAVHVGMANTAAQNQAGMYNKTGQQRVADNNVDIGNKQIDLGMKTQQQAFDNSRALANDKADADKFMADHYDKRSARKADQGSQRIGAAGKMVGSVLGAVKSDEKTKKELKPVSSSAIEEFLAALKPKSFKYKEKFSDGDDGKKIGFIMQDIEKTKVGKDISRDVGDGMKGYDAQSLQGVTLAALKHLMDKIDGKDK